MEKKTKAILDVLQGNTPERTPIWLMRQAGRYLPEYRKLRANAKDFLNMCLTPDYAVEVTLQPLRRLISMPRLFLPIFFLVPMALGNGLEFREGEGPVLDKITDEAAMARLTYDDRKVQPVYESLRRVKAALPAHVSLIGFCGAPWTVACYMIDGNSKNDFAIIKTWTQQHPAWIDRLIGILVDASEQYLIQQIEAGAEILQIFDSWGGLLAGEDFARWVIAPTRDLVSRLKSALSPHPDYRLPTPSA